MRSGPYERVISLSEQERAALLNDILADPEARSQVELSFAQRQLWLIGRMLPESTFSNVPVVYRFRSPMDVEALRKALTRVCERHEILRSRFLDADGEPLVLISASEPPFQVMDLRESAAADREATWRGLVAREITRPFDLSGESLIRCSVLIVGDNDYVVALNVHHIVMDGWSLGIILSELSDRYTEATSGRLAEIPALPLQYADYVAWQNDALRSGHLDDEFTYWRDTLAGAPLILNLPLDRPWPARRGFLGDTVTAFLSAEVVRRLREVGSSQGASPFMVFHSAYAAALSHYSGQEDILVGIAAAGRDIPAFNDVVGMFVIMLVLRLDLTGDPSFRELVRRTRDIALGAYAHARFPFEKLVERLEVGRSPDRNPVFQACFAYHPLDTQEFKLGGVAGELIEFPPSESEFDLDLRVQAREDGGADVSLVYATELFERGTAERFLRHFLWIAETASRQPDSPLSELPCIEERERCEQLGARHPAIEPTVECLHQFVEQGAARFADRIAVVHADRTLTYRELDESANQLAWYLQMQGVEPDMLVGLDVPRKPDMLVAIIAILKAGGAYVPLGELPAEGLRSMLTDSAVPVIVTDSSVRARYANCPGIVVCPDDDRGEVAQCPTRPPSSSAGGENLAHVMYTSGGTGTPKAVLMTHRSVVGQVEYYGTVLRPEEVAGVLASAPAGSDGTVLEYFVTLLLGGTVVLVDSVLDLHRLPNSGSVTLLQTTPRLLQELLEHGPLPDGLITVLARGESLNAVVAEQTYASASVERLYNVYAVTEYSAGSVLSLVERGCLAPAMGEPLPGVRCYVLDRRRRPAAIGSRGELYLGGPGLSLGYLHCPDLTRERFRPDPFGQTPGERMFRTGDLVRYRADGQLEYLGRVDEQVTVDGCRVGLGEVESVLNEHGQVARAAAVASRTPDADGGLTAFVVLRDGFDALDDLKHYLARRLPSYMLPASLTVLESLPLNAHGRLDIANLPEPGSQIAERTRPGKQVPPPNTTEERVAAIWRNILNQPEVGVQDNFFSLGGQSLLALRMISHIKQDFGVSIPLRAVFDTPTIAGLAKLLTDGKPPPATSAPQLRPRLTPVVQLRRGGTHPPVIVIHGAAGDVTSYADLSRALLDGRPVYGIEATGLNREARPLATIPELAEHYLDRLGGAGVTGPMVFAGWSTGGAIAYEMAYRVAARGSASPLLLLDAVLGSTGCLDDEPGLVAQYGQHLLRTVGREGEDLPRDLVTTGAVDRAELPDPVRLLLDWATERGLLEAETAEAEFRRALRVFSTNMRALGSYSPEPFSTPALYLMAAEAAENSSELLRSLMGRGLLVLSTPGDHYTMMRQPHIASAARLIDMWLEGLGL